MSRRYIIHSFVYFGARNWASSHKRPFQTAFPMLQLNTHFRLCCRAKRDGEVRNQKKKPKEQHSQTATSSFVGDFFSPISSAFSLQFPLLFSAPVMEHKGMLPKINEDLETWQKVFSFALPIFAQTNSRIVCYIDY